MDGDQGEDDGEEWTISKDRLTTEQKKKSNWMIKWGVKLEFPHAEGVA